MLDTILFANGWALLEEPAYLVAPRLLGGILQRRTKDGRLLQGRIIETEAYDQSDAASHSYRGQTARTAVMFGPSGYLYVYFTYGMHYCCNIVTGPAGYGAAVLIRALEPQIGEDIMAKNRRGAVKIGSISLTNGPAKLCEALQITKAQNGVDLRTGDVRLLLQPAIEPTAIVQTTRIGITRAINEPWRFYIKNNPYVSRPTKAV